MTEMGEADFITFTHETVEELKNRALETGLDLDSDGVYLRVSVLPGGCSGFQYSLDFAQETEEDDEVYEVQGIKVVIDPFSKQYLDGVLVRFVETTMGSGFVFENPNASGGCGCGSSFTV